MKIQFTKMHGIGNDYIYIDCFKQNLEELDIKALAIKLSDRHFGIGGDGIILVCPSGIADAKMRMFNLDGSEGKMCGNGIRCVAKFVYDNKIAVKDTLTIETLSGVKTLSVTTNGDKVQTVRVDMGKPILDGKMIPTVFSGEVINKQIEIDNKTYNVTCVSMGNPHCVLFCDDIESLKLEEIGPKFEKSSYFPENINTEFVKIIDDKTLSMRVWERGSGETLACGTGACAVAVSAVLKGICKKGEDITINLLGGILTINYSDISVFMTGSATTVFTGEIDL